MEDWTEGNVVVTKHELAKCQQEDESKMVGTLPDNTS